MTDTPSKNDATLTAIAESLADISETLETMLGLLQEREAGFKARKAAFGDRKPAFRRSFDRDDDAGERRPYRKSYDRDGDDAAAVELFGLSDSVRHGRHLTPFPPVFHQTGRSVSRSG